MMKRYIALLMLAFLVSCAGNKRHDSLLETISTYDGRASNGEERVFAGCESSLKLEGIMSVECCTPRDKCIPAATAIYDYSVAAKVEPGVLSISMQASPWHVYDGDARILTIEELAEIAKGQLKKEIKRIDLIASWTGVVPDLNGKPLAQRLSDLLDGFPVTGKDGFVWVAKDGSVRTTHQAFTTMPKCPYGVHPGGEVFVSLIWAWLIQYEEDYVKKGNAEGILRAGAGWDVFMLCPERALQSFEAAATLSNPIASYNAALIRLDRNKDGDVEAATNLLMHAAKLGDKKAQVQLQKLRPQTR